MARLAIRCLGPFQVTLEGQPVTEFKSKQVRALLAYLAVEADRPHAREVLAGLLWPEWTQREALGNLRYALSDLRRAIGDREADPPYLLISREALQVNVESDQWVDAAEFDALTGPLLAPRREGGWSREGLERAVALYRGRFLEGFTSESAALEEWALMTGERLGRGMMAALEALAAEGEAAGDYGRAEHYARRQLELEPWAEEAHRQLMRALALGGKRAAALAAYESCVQSLAEALAVAPSAETEALCQDIRQGRLGARERIAVRPESRLPTRLPSFLAEERAPVRVERPLFVGREAELAQLDGYLAEALAGRGRVALVIGEAGSGKTTLMAEFARRAQEKHAGLAAASGNCNAHTGLGDPYLPFRELLQQLTGEVQARWEAGAISRGHAQRLWEALPAAAQAMEAVGPDLIDTFAPGRALLARAEAAVPAGTPWLARLEALVQRAIDGPAGQNPQQNDLFEQYARVLQAVARERPLLLWVDDLQWGDRGSIGLLFHLGRRLRGSRVLLLAAYRPEEVAIGREGERHPLAPVVSELGQIYGELTVEVGREGGRAFVEALLDSELNRLGEGFRQMLTQQTRGQGLFTTELLRGMQERGDLVKDAEGYWVAGESLDWETLPARVEAVMGERVGRLARPLRALLRAASVEGQEFTAEVLARVQGMEAGEVLNTLSRELDKRHRLVRAASIRRSEGRPLFRYQFRHQLLQTYLYGELDEVERVYLHGEVGRALEALYGGEAEAEAAIAVQLARHYQEARIEDKAIHYLRRAGERAVQVSGYQEGIEHLSTALALLMERPPTHERDVQELGLQLALSLAWLGGYDNVTPEMEAIYGRARVLSERLGEPRSLCTVLGGLAIIYYVRAEYPAALSFAQEALDLAQETDDKLWMALGHWYQGIILFGMGAFEAALDAMAQALALYDPEKHRQESILHRGVDMGLSAQAYVACSLWCLGYPDQAAAEAEAALQRAEELNHPFTSADVLQYGGCLHAEMQRDPSRLKTHAEALIALSETVVPAWRGTGEMHQGVALVMEGREQEGVALIRQGEQALLGRGAACYWSSNLGWVAQGQAQVGELAQALQTAEKALALVADTGERYWEAELYRCRGEILRGLEKPEAAEESLEKAMAVAREQKARSWELRAATSLARLWASQGREAEARELLQGVYQGFTEGWETADLREARALLEVLAREPGGREREV